MDSIIMSQPLILMLLSRIVCVCVCVCVCAVAVIEVKANPARPINEQEFASVEKCKIVFHS